MLSTTPLVNSSACAATSTTPSSNNLRGGQVPAPSTPKVHIEVLYLFSGEPRDNDLTMEFVRVGRTMGFEVEVTEVDICHGPGQDLRHQAAWDMIFEQISDKRYAIIFMSPPCATFSRSLFNALVKGPLPLRSFQHPKGFPWLTGCKQEEIQGHFFFRRAIHSGS